MTPTESGVVAEEMMVVAGAREIHDRELVMIGMRLPILCYAVAKALHAPHAVGLFESGLVRDSPPSGAVRTMCDLPNQLGAVAAGRLADVMGELGRGRVALGFLGAGEVDRHGNLNTTWVERDGRRIRLPGSGGAADIASLAGRLVVILREEPHRFRERVEYRTSLGHGDGPTGRARAGAPPGGPVRLITQRAVYSFPAPTYELTVESIHPGVDPASLSFPAARPGHLRTTSPATPAEVEQVRRFDAAGFWTRRD